MSCCRVFRIRHCGVLCCGQHDYFEYRSGGYYPSVHAGAERDLSGRYRTDCTVVLPKPEKHCAVYRLCIAFTAVQSIAAAFPIPVVSPLLRALPLSALGFGWLIPAAVGLLIGLLVPKKAEKA